MSQTHTHSYYAASANQELQCPTLQGHHSADICIVGAGITGLSAALNLAERGYKVTVLEANLVGWGASGRSGGQMIFGYGCDMSVIEKSAGKVAARSMWDMSVEAIDVLRERVEQHHIRCDLQQGHLHAAIKPRQMNELEEWQHGLEKDYGYDSLALWDQQDVQLKMQSERYLGGLFDANSGHIHPLNYTLGLAQAALDAGVTIYTDSAVTKVTRKSQANVCQTAQGQIKAQQVLFCGNAYMGKLVPEISNKIMPVGTYIGATEPLGEARAKALINNNMAIADVNFVLDYFRLSADYRMLFGGRVSYSTLAPPNLMHSMRQRMLGVFPQLADVKMAYSWGGNVAITMNRGPHFGRVGQDLYFAQGFSGHGIAATGLAGKLLAEAVAGQAERFDLFKEISHLPFPGGSLLKTPALMLAMTWYRLRDML
ncbi:MAG: FAD-binding oxidoreductase [Oceanospirillaceae bacterium]|nr:FAD-binding oxidoreductase [Oceanospirillaceae bacterium]